MNFQSFFNTAGVRKCESQQSDTAGVRKAAKRLGMTADLGPPIPDYVDEHFQDAEPSGAEVEASAPGSVGNDLPNED